MAFAGAIATCIMLVLLLRVPFAGGQSTEATSEVEHILSESGCGAFAGLVATTTGAGEAFRAQIAGGDGLTIFCPDDDAVAAFGAGRFSNLSADCQVELLLYHGVPKLYSEEALGGGVIIDSDVATLAASSAGWWRRLLRPGDYDIGVYGGATVTILVSSSINAAIVTNTAVDDDHLAVHCIDAVLVPEERVVDWAVVALLVCYHA